MSSTNQTRSFGVSTSKNSSVSVVRPIAVCARVIDLFYQITNKPCNSSDNLYFYMLSNFEELSSNYRQKYPFSKGESVTLCRQLLALLIDHHTMSITIQMNQYFYAREAENRPFTTLRHVKLLIFKEVLIYRINGSILVYTMYIFQFTHISMQILSCIQ